MPKRTPRRRFNFGRRIRPRWTAGTTNGLLAVPVLSTASIVLVQPTDYQQTGTLEAAAMTLARIRGSIALWSNASQDAIPVALTVVTSDLGTLGAPYSFAPGAAGIANLVEEEVLWHRQVFVGAGPAVPINLEFDVRAKRRLDNSTVLLWVENWANLSVVFAVAAARIVLIGS